MIIITDVHGCYKTLMALLAQIPEEEKAKGIAFCGDNIDRGPASREVVEFIIKNEYDCVLGNHEDMALHSMNSATASKGMTALDAYYKNITDPGYLINWGKCNDIWIPNGGDKCLFSYEDFDHSKLDDAGKPTMTFDEETFLKHIEWFKTLPYVKHFGKVKDENGDSLVISHSSCAAAFYKQNFTTDNANLTGEQKMSILWSRPSIPKKLKGKFSIYGHTPNPKPIIKEHFANIDTGCYLNGHYNMENMTAFSFPSKKIWQQKCIDFDIKGSAFGDIE